MVEANCSKDIWTQRSCPTLPVWCDYHPSYQSRSLLPSLESTVVPGPKKCSSCRWVGAEWFTDSSLRKPCCSQSRHLRALFLSTDDMTLCRISHWIDNNKTPKLYLLELKKKSDIYIRIKEKGAVSIERSAGPDRGLSRRRTESPLGTHHVDEPLNRSEKAASVWRWKHSDYITATSVVTLVCPEGYRWIVQVTYEKNYMSSELRGSHFTDGEIGA